MRSRRAFIKTMSKGAALSTVAFSSTPTLASQIFSQPSRMPVDIRIGIIGAENSHTIDYGNLFNTDNKFPGVEVKYVWGETDEFARNAAKKGNIPKIVKDPKEMLGNIDALIVDHRHAKYHLKAATPFIKQGIPTFIDKPFCYRAVEGKEFLELAQKYNAPVTSYSSVAHSNSTFDKKKQAESIGKIAQVVQYGPVDINSKYGGIFFYGVHLVQPLMYIFGEDIERVKVTKDGRNGSANLVYKNGLFVTLIFKNHSYSWETFVETEEGLVELKSRVEESDPAINYTDMVEMFRTGNEPRSYQSILNCVSVLEALEKSVESQQWEDVISISIE